MQPAPDTGSPADRLLALRNHFTKQERFMSHALRNLQAQLEGYHGQGINQELQQATTDLSIDLTHVRMAIAGADEELAIFKDLDICLISYQRLGA